MTDAIKFEDRYPASILRKTADGYLVGEVRAARIGTQDYLGEELGRPDIPVVTVYRPEETVFSRDSMATFAGKPITRGHPPVMVDASNWKEYSAGDLGNEIARDGEFVKVPFVLMDAAAIADVESGTNQVSMGYTCGIKWGDGVAPDGTPYQATQTGPLRINHLAIVPNARGGSELRIGDAANNWGATPLVTPPSKPKEDTMSDALTSVVLCDKAVNVPAAAAPAIETYKTDAAKKLADAEAAHKAAIAAKDAELAKRDAEIDKLKAAQLSDADLDARVAARATLIADAAKVAKSVKTQGLSDADIRAAVVKAKLGDRFNDGWSPEYIAARFDAMVEEAPKADPVRDAMMANDGGAKPVDINTLYQQRDAKLADAWQGKTEKGA